MINNLSVLAIIPARGGSKGVPKKNIAPVGGRPLIEWTISAAKQSHCVDRVILSSDDADIIAVAKAAGCEVPFVREPFLSSDTATSIDVLLDALNRVSGYDIVILLQPTSPLRTTEDIDAALKLFVNSDAPSCVSVCEAPSHPWLTFAHKNGRLHSYCEEPTNASTRRQDLPPAFVLNGALYLAYIDRVRSDRTLFHPGLSIAYVMPGERSCDIDTWDDLKTADELLSQSRHHLTL